MVSESHAPQLDIVISGNADYGADFELALAVAEFSGCPGKPGPVVLRQGQNWLIGGRPEFAAFVIAQINKVSKGVVGGVFAPAGDSQILPAAVAAPGGCDHQVI